MRLTPNLIALIVAQIRAGSFPSVAAEAAGVPREVFRRWLRRGRKRRRGRYARFRREVRQAQAQARAKAEMDVRNKDVKFWLRYGPGQTSPPWAAAKRQARARDAAAASLAELRGLLGELTDLLAPFPEARLALTQFLDARPDSAGSRSPAL